MKYKIASLLLVVAAVVLGGVTTAHASHQTTTKLFIQDGEKTTVVDVPLKNNAGGLEVEVADLGNDGTGEIIVANGVGNEPRVRVLRSDGSEIGSFLAYAPSMGTGVNISVCDLTGDGVNEIITAPQRRGGPHVRVFNQYGEPINGGFFAYAEHMRAGVNIACGDLDDDQKAELVTLPEAGGGPHVRTWEWNGQKMQMEQQFFTKDGQNDRRGLVGIVKDRKIIVTPQKTNKAVLTAYEMRDASIHTSSLQDGNESSLSVSYIADVFEVDGQVAYSAGDSNSYHIADTSYKIAEGSGTLNASSGNLDDDNEEERVFTSNKPQFHIDEAADGKKIIVDISDQRLYAYNKGILEHTFPVSTGKFPYATPQGDHSVLAKPFHVNYQWSYGPNNPNNYDLGIVPYNLRIYPHIYIHYAYWHNNFGHPMSHGCINVSLDNMKWAYDWADKGMPVKVRE